MPTGKSNTAAVAIGSTLVMPNNTNLRIEATARGLSNGKPGVGISGGLSIKV